MNLKDDFLFFALLFRITRTFQIFKKVNAFGIVRKPRTSGIIKTKMFWKKKNEDKNIQLLF